MSIADHELDAPQTTFLQGPQKLGSERPIFTGPHIEFYGKQVQSDHQLEA